MRLSGIKRDLPTRQNGHNVIALWRLLFAGSVSYAPHAIPRLPPEGWLGGLALPARTEAADRLIDRLAVAAESSAFRTCWFDTLLCLVYCWRAEGCRPHDTSPGIAGQSGARYRLAATWLKVPLKLVPTVVMTATAATAISAAIKPYSIAVTPLSSLTRREIRLSTYDLPYISVISNWYSTNILSEYETIGS